MGKDRGSVGREEINLPNLKPENQFFFLLFKIAKKLFLERFRMEMNLQFSIDDLVNPPVSPSYFSSGEEMDVDIQSVEATASTSDDSDIEVIACYRQLPVQTQQTVGGRQMTTDLSGCSDNAFPEFPWDDFESLLITADEQADPLVMGAGPKGGQRTGSPVISQCGQLRPQIDTPLSPPANERGPYNGPSFSEQQQQNDHPLPLSSHIQGISVRMAAYCGQPNTALYGDMVTVSSVDEVTNK